MFTVCQLTQKLMFVVSRSRLIRILIVAIQDWLICVFLCWYIEFSILFLYSVKILGHGEPSMIIKLVGFLFLSELIHQILLRNVIEVVISDVSFSSISQWIQIQISNLLWSNERRISWYIRTIGINNFWWICWSWMSRLRWYDFGVALVGGYCDLQTREDG